MLIRVPETFLDKGLTDRELVFANLMWKIRKNFVGAKMYRMYSIDIKTILGSDPHATANTAVDRLEEWFDFDKLSTDTWYITCKWKQASPVEVQITDEEAIRIYCYLLGRTAGDKWLDENNKSMHAFVVDRKRVYNSYGNLLDFQEFSQL